MVLVVAGAVWAALMVGEYSTPQWLALRSKERTERERLVALRAEVDSLARVKKLVETDPAMQERVAREQYGMLRKGEVEFTLVRPDR
ncbi:MAG: septum formation initiator family protein [Gemmatimonadales bacterium]|nr:septum formation initiator family protein [Gemmatimonadales bacterium]